MFINPISTNFKAKVPLSEYKGPVLKLTKPDLKKIEKLKNIRYEYEMELISIDNLLAKKKISNAQFQFLMNKKSKIEALISEIVSKIKEIKINRLNIQKSKLTNTQ